MTSSLAQASAAGGAARAAGLRRRGAALILRAGSLVAFAAVFAVFALASPLFFTFANIANVLAQSAILGVLAFGMTIVVIGGGSNVVTGGIDLSLANNLGLCAAVYAVLAQHGHGDGVALPAALLVGLAVGAVNAAAVVLLGILPLLATLAVMNICAGIELVLTQNTVVPAATSLLSAIAGAGPFGIPLLAYALLAVALVLSVAVQWSPAGLRLYAVGGFPEAAQAAGLPVRRYVAATYLLSGLCAAIAAVLSAALLSGSSTGSGDMLLSIVVAALLGVVFSRRLVPTIGGTLLSTLFIGVLINGFQLLNISSYWVNGVEGVLILLVVAATSVLRRGDGR
jgi:ribose transport system permease protein